MQSNNIHHDGNPLLDYFVKNGNRAIHKWIDYFEVYHHSFKKYRNTPITFLEIGIQNGGSLQMWRHYFGPEAKIIGVDIDPACRDLEKEGFDIWIGDQSDPEFWNDFIRLNPNIDIVLDDGGHTMKQQIQSFISLFPHMKNGGTYLCEDTHTSYFPAHGGGLNRSGTFHEFIKTLIDDMHTWYHGPLDKIGSSYMAQNLYSLSVYDSIVVLEKRYKNPPLILARGNDGHKKNPPALTHIEMRRFFGVPD